MHLYIHTSSLNQSHSASDSTSTRSYVELKIACECRWGGGGGVKGVSLYTILFHFKDFMWESMILSLLPPTCKPYHITILLHHHCAIYAPPTDPPFYNIHHTILVIAISCKGQFVVVMPLLL